MNLTTMRQRVRENLSDRSTVFNDPTVDEGLNLAHRWLVPDATAGVGLDSEYELTIAAGTATYTLPEETIQQPDASLEDWRLDDDRIAVTSDWQEFWDSFRRSDTSQAKPSMVLIRGYEVTVRQVPLDGHTLYFPCTRYPVALTSAGVAYEPRAWADIYYAAWEIASTNGLENIAAEILPKLNERLRHVRRRDFMRPERYEPTDLQRRGL